MFWKDRLSKDNFVFRMKLRDYQKVIVCIYLFWLARDDIFYISFIMILTGKGWYILYIIYHVRLTKDDGCTELELAAVRAMSAVVCCGPVFDTNGLNDDGYIYNWLDTLLSSHDDRVGGSLGVIEGFILEFRIVLGQGFILYWKSNLQLRI